MRHPRAAWLVALLLLASAGAGAEGTETPGPRQPETLRGGWVAAAGASVLRGRWTATPLPKDPSSVQGTWTLIDAKDDTIVGGTWAGRQQGRRWRGAWSARTPDGRLFSGSWEADGQGRAGQSFADMLVAAGTRQITGSWRMGGARGRWWLKA